MIAPFFHKRKSLLTGEVLSAAVDNHSHVLYGVDDGIQTLDDSLKVLNCMEKARVETLWLTPHVMEDVPNTTAGLQERFAQLQAAWSGKARLCLAAEYMMDTLFVQRLRERDLLLHGGDLVLMETSTWSPPVDFWTMLGDTLKAGYRPLIAHPERYRYMGMNDYERLQKMGCRMQLNLPSIAGAYGEEAKEKAQTLLDKGWYAMFGSDCHRFHSLETLLEMEVLKPATLAQLAAIKR